MILARTIVWMIFGAILKKHAVCMMRMIGSMIGGDNHYED